MHPVPHRRIATILGLLVWFSCAWFGSWEGNPNNAVRLFSAISLAEHGTAEIDEFAGLTIDKAEFEGHAYLDKAPGMTIMALPATYAAERLTGISSADVPHRSDDPEFIRYLRLRLRLAVATGPAVLTGLATALLFDLALSLCGSATAALVAALAFAFGTPVWAWSTTIFGHAPVAALYVVAVWALWRRSGPPSYAIAGAALGWAVVIEHQAALAGTVLAIAGLTKAWRRPDRTRMLAAGIIAAVVALLPFAVYGVVAFGTPFRIGYSGVVGWQGMQRGLFGLGVPDVRVLALLLVGPRGGLLWVAPVLMPAAMGLGELRPRLLAATCATCALTVLLVNAAYVYWDGGNGIGPRISIPATGLLALGFAPFYAGLRTRAGRSAALAILALSSILNAMAAAGGVFAPENELWPAVWEFKRMLLPGRITSFTGDWLGWPAWTGLAAWAVIALPVLAWLARGVVLQDASRNADT